MERFIGIITICIFLLLVLRLCIVGVVYVQSNSMQPLISKNEGIIVDQLAFGLNLPWLDRPLFAWRSPSHGDIVVFENPHDQGKLWLKRVMGLQETRFTSMIIGFYLMARLLVILMKNWKQ